MPVPPLNNDSIVPEVPAPEEERLGAIASNSEAMQIKLDHGRAQIKEIEQRLKHRDQYAPKIFSFTVAWAIGLSFILIWQGFGSKIGFFNLSDKVLVTLIGGTTLNVMWSLHIVLRSVFPSNGGIHPGGILEKIRQTFGEE